MALPTIVGEWRCGSDYELRFAPSGVAVGTLRCVASSAKKVNDEWVTTGEIWVTVTMFSSLAEMVAEMNPGKGDLVHVSGTIQEEEWETKEGEKRKTIKVIANGFSVRRRKGEGKDGGSQQSQRPQQQASEDPWGPPSASDEPPF
jgi:single-strand DNA-binding protein